MKRVLRMGLGRGAVVQISLSAVERLLGMWCGVGGGVDRYHWVPGNGCCKCDGGPGRYTWVPNGLQRATGAYMSNRTTDVGLCVTSIDSVLSLQTGILERKLHIEYGVLHYHTSTTISMQILYNRNVKTIPWHWKALRSHGSYFKRTYRKLYT